LFPDPEDIPEEGVNLWDLGSAEFLAEADPEMPGESKKFLVMAGASAGDASAHADYNGDSAEFRLFVSPNEIQVSPGAINLGHPDDPEPPSEITFTLVEGEGSSGVVFTGSSERGGMTWTGPRFTPTLTYVSDDLGSMNIELAAEPGTEPSALVIATEVRCRYNNRQKKSHMILSAGLMADRAYVESASVIWTRGVPDPVRIWDEHLMRVAWVGREVHIVRVWRLPVFILRPAPTEGWVMRADTLADDVIEYQDAAGQWLPLDTGSMDAVGLEKVADLQHWPRPFMRTAMYGPLTWRGSRLGGPVVFRYEFFPLELKPPSERETTVVPRVDLMEAIVGHDGPKPRDLLDQAAARVRTAQNDPVRIVTQLQPTLDRRVAWEASPEAAGSFDPPTAINDDVSVFTPSETDPEPPGEALLTVTYAHPDTGEVFNRARTTAVVAPQELVQVIFGEASTREDEPIEARRAIADVIRNRVNDPRWSNTYVGVITQGGQFDAVGGDLYNGAVSREHLLGLWIFNREPYDESVSAACEIFSDELGPQTGGAVGYFAPMTGDDGTSQRAEIDAALEAGDIRRAEDIVPTVIREGVTYRYADILAGIDEQIVIVPGVTRTVFIREKPGPDEPGVVQLEE